MNHVSLTVTGTNVNYTDDSRRKSLPCAHCKQPTTGRAGRKAACLDCVLKGILQLFQTAA